MPTPLENLQKSHNKLESDYYKNHEKKWQVELDEAKDKLKTVNERLQNKTDPKYDNLLGAKKLLEEKIQNILKLEIPHAIEDSLREAEAMRLEENIKIAEEKFKGDASTDYEGFKKFQLEKIKKLFENGVDVVVTHGNDVRDPKTREAMYDKNGRKLMSTSTDQDANAAFMFLELANTGKKYNFAYRDVKGSGAAGLQSSSHEFVPKGESHIPTKEDWGKTFLHIDTSGRKGVSIEYDNKTETTHIYVDHHISKTLKENTSAGELTLELLKNLDMIKAEPWMEAYAKFNTEHDNFTFKIDRDHLINNYWKTPRGLMKVIPREQFIQFFKDGRDPDVPFTDAELDTIKINKRSLRKIANGQKTHMDKSRELVANGEIEAIIEGVTSYTDELGIISFNTVETEIDEEGNVKDIKNAAEGGVVAKALNIPTFIKFWKNGGGFFMTSTRDLTPLFERIKDKIPGLKLVRGKMLIYAQPNQLKPNELDEVVTKKILDEEKTKKAGVNVYKVEKFVKSKNPKEFEEVKKKFIENKEVFQNYYVQKNRQHLDKDKMLEIMGLVEKNNYENLPEPKLERSQRLLKIRLSEAEAAKDTERIKKVQKALGIIETAYSKIAPEKEATPEEIKALLESVRGTISMVQETRTSLGNEIAVLKESIAEYETLINEEETEDTEPESVVTKAASKKRTPKASPALTANPDAKKDTALEKEADLQALKNLNAGKSLVYRNADGTFSYKKINAVSKGGKVRFEGETAWIPTSTVEEWIKEKYSENLELEIDTKLSNIQLTSAEGKIETGKIEIAKLPNEIIQEFNGEHEVYINNPELQGTIIARDGKYLFRAMQGRMFTIARVGEFYLPFYISSSGTDGKKEGEWYPFFGYTGNWIVKGDIEKDGEMKYSDEITKVQDILRKNFKIPVKYLNQFGEMGYGEKFIRDDKNKIVQNPDWQMIFDINDVAKYESWFIEKENKGAIEIEETEWVQQKTGLYPTNVVNEKGNYSASKWIANITSLVEGKAKITKTPELKSSDNESDIETFKIYQSGMMIGEKKGAKEKVFAMNKKSNEVLPIEEGWKYATSGGQKDFEYFYGELFDVKSIKSIKGLKFSDFDITPAKMNPDGTLKEKGKFTIKK